MQSIAADFFDEILETIHDLIQGPNFENLMYSQYAENNFGEVCKIIFEQY